LSPKASPFLGLGSDMLGVQMIRFRRFHFAVLEDKGKIRGHDTYPPLFLLREIKGHDTYPSLFLLC